MTAAVNAASAIFLREVRAYFLTPLAYVFIAVFLLALGAFTFEIGRLFDTNQVDLAPFFVFHPWVYLAFLPALAMRLWADEARGGTLELLLSAPTPAAALVAGKFLAAWIVALVALALTAPLWIAMNVLGAPDNAAIAAGYVMSALMAGGYLALSCAMSALAGNQVVAFVLASTVGFLVTASGLPIVSSGAADILGPAASDALRTLSFLTHFEAAQRGVIELRAVLAYLYSIVFWLGLCTLWIAARRSA